MTGVLAGLRVVDFSSGIAGPVATMLLADHGAQVTRIEPPGGHRLDACSGTRVWLRGKRRATLDLADADERAAAVSLAAAADVVVETFAPGVAARLGLDYVSLRAGNERIIHCSVTGYGEDGPLTERPGLDALVAARTGHQFEVRGADGGTIGRLSGAPMLPDLEQRDDLYVGPARPGPLFSAVPWPSLAAAYLATLGISAALRAREVTGLGQHVHTSLLQGVLASTVMTWCRAERPDVAGFQSWIVDPRAPKGFFRAADGAWTHHWVPLPGFILGAAAGEELAKATELAGPRTASVRIATMPEDMVLLHSYDEQLRDAVARFPSQDWVRLAAEVGVPVQRVRPPEEALRDAAFRDDGCVATVHDPEVGPILTVGRTYELSGCADAPLGRIAVPGEHTEVVRDEAATASPVRTGATGASLSHPLEGVVVVDLGLAIAGPFGTQLLSDLGATVLKVNRPGFDAFWLGTHLAMCCNRGKQSIGLDIKSAPGREVLDRLIARADVVHHNMRYDAVRRLGLDYETLRDSRPDLIYCHTRGHERGSRETLPGNDQTAAALAGITWMEGAADAGGMPLWPPISLGDTGNGFLSAIAVIQALYHRDRTGEGQFVTTSIVAAHLLNASMTWVAEDRSATSERPRLDPLHLGWDQRYRLYETADGWLCLAAVSDEHWSRVGDLVGDDVEAGFRTRSVEAWFEVLDGAGIPCEVADPDFVLSMFDDPDLQARGWITSYEHPVVGRLDAQGILVDLDATPGRVAGPPPVLGQHTDAILSWLGYGADEIAELLTSGAATGRAAGS